MKRFIIAILAVLYLGTSTGATIHMHYCMGKLADWGLKDTNSKICASCGMEKSHNDENGCCQDEQQFFKDHSAQKLSDNNFQLLELTYMTIPVIFSELPKVCVQSATESNPVSHAPPRSPDIAIYIFKRSFLI